ncbi:MAG TPA: HAMP domain-containing sensor histidine kinase [Opitutaceae bacterium]|nr:HAMP domain-containing sensor histidine kinase [Opitutaceae bacterium]
MKVSFPLSLKVTLWLLLNLLLLGVAATAFLIAQGGLSWDSLVAGPAGERLHALATVVSGEVAAADPAARNDVLDRFGAAYHANFVIVRNHGAELAGKPVTFPPEVRQRIDEGPLDEVPHARPGLGLRRGPGGPPGMTSGNPPRGRGRGQPFGMPARGGFLVRGGDPVRWWVGLRVPFPQAGDLPAPATLVLRVRSFWDVVNLLGLETWFFGVAGVLALSILFWLPLVRSITRHLRALTAATERIAEGRFETRVATSRRDELGRLGESVNRMAGRLDTLVNGQRRFLADIAHELGSPIGRLQVATEILESRLDPALREHVADVRDEVQHMAGLVNELLAFTKAGMRPRDAELATVSLDAVVSEVLAREDPTHRVLQRVVPGLHVLADEPLLTRAIANLIRNALRYAGESGAITLHADKNGDNATIVVEDEGPGVPAAALERLGEPFYRPESARTRETGGVGLGLAIVRSALSACGGNVHFSNRSPRGFRAEVTGLRLSQPPASGA